MWKTQEPKTQPWDRAQAVLLLASRLNHLTFRAGGKGDRALPREPSPAPTMSLLCSGGLIVPVEPMASQDIVS